MNYKNPNSIPSISIIIPIYNEERIILNLLKSLNKQTLQNFQVICVDNGSTDRTAEVIKKFIGRSCYHLYYDYEGKPGPGNARKKGAEFVLNQFGNRRASKSHILATTDADCIAQSNWTLAIENTFQSNRCGIAGGAHTSKTIVDKKIQAITGISDFFKTIATVNEFIAIHQIGKIKLSGPNSAVLTDSYLKSGGYTQPLNPDGSIGVKELKDLEDRVINAGYSVAFIPCPIFSSRRRHLEELIESRDMYYYDKKDTNKRFISIRDSETKLLNLALSTVKLSRWKKYQNLLIDRVIFNMIIRPAIDNQLDLVNLKKIGFSGHKIQSIKNMLKPTEKYNIDFDSLLQNIPILFQDISNAIREIVFTSPS